MFCMLADVLARQTQRSIMKNASRPAATTGPPLRWPPPVGLKPKPQNDAPGRGQRLTQMVHHPRGLMTPSTFLHAFGGSNRAQLSQRRFPFGLSRYCTTDLGILVCALAWRRAIAVSNTGAAPIHVSALSNDRRENLEERDGCNFDMGSSTTEVAPKTNFPRAPGRTLRQINSGAKIFSGAACFVRQDRNVQRRISLSFCFNEPWSSGPCCRGHNNRGVANGRAATGTSAAQFRPADRPTLRLVPCRLSTTDAVRPPL